MISYPQLPLYSETDLGIMGLEDRVSFLGSQFDPTVDSCNPNISHTQAHYCDAHYQIFTHSKTRYGLIKTSAWVFQGFVGEQMVPLEKQIPEHKVIYLRGVGKLPVGYTENGVLTSPLFICLDEYGCNRLSVNVEEQHDLVRAMDNLRFFLQKSIPWFAIEIRPIANICFSDAKQILELK